MNDVTIFGRAGGARELRRRVTGAFMLGALPLTMVACVPATVREPEPRPLEVVEAWHEALTEGRVEAAYSLLGGPLRERYTLKAFRSLYARQRDAMILQARDVLRRVQDTRARESAEVRVGNTLVVLVKEEPGWRLTRPAGGLHEGQK